SHRLARRSALGDAGHHPDGGVEELRLQHADLHRRAAEHSRHPLRGGEPRWGERAPAVSSRDATGARADVSVRGGDHGDRLLPALRRALRDDPGRAGEQHAEHRAAHVPAGLSLVEHGLCRRRGVRAVRHRPGVDLRADEAPAAMKRATTTLLYALLVGGVVITLAPLMWMVSASFMPAGEATAVPPRWWPSHFTLEQYRALFTRMNVGRHAASSALVATATTLISLALNSMAGYAFAKLRFAGRDRIFAALLGALVIPSQVAMLPLFLLLK